MLGRGGQQVGRGFGDLHLGQLGHHRLDTPFGQGAGRAAGGADKAQQLVVVAHVAYPALGAQHVHRQAFGHGGGQIPGADHPENRFVGFAGLGRRVVAQNPEGGEQPAVGGEIARQTGLARREGEDVVAELALQEGGCVVAVHLQYAQVLERCIGQGMRGGVGAGLHGTGGGCQVVHGGWAVTGVLYAGIERGPVLSTLYHSV